MGRCDWDDFEPPPKKCGYIPVDSGDDDGGYWWIPPIDGEDPPGPPPPGEEEEEELFGWYCFVRTGCHWMPIGGPGTDDRESGPYENFADCTWNCSELKWYCRYPNTWFAHCYLKFTFLETHDAFLKYETRALCEAECLKPQPPPRGRWMCDNMAGTCSYDPLAHFWEGYASWDDCDEECRYGRWECDTATGTCYWVPQMQPVHPWQKTKKLCEEYCPEDPPILPGSPSTGAGDNICIYWHCVDDDCKKITARASQYPRAQNGDMWTYHEQSDSYFFDCAKVKAKLTNTDPTKFADYNVCKNNCPVPDPKLSGPVTGAGGNPMCNYWKCNMALDPPKCEEKWVSTADYPIEDYAWMWSWDGRKFNFNCPEARPTIAQDNGGHSHPRTCQRNCPPPEGIETSGISTDNYSYWRCDSETGVCSEVYILTTDYPEEQYPEYWNERGSFLWDVAKADIIDSDEDNHLTENGCNYACPDPVKVFGNVPGEAVTETEGSYFTCNRNTWICDITIWNSSEYPIDLYPQFYDPDTGFFMKDVAEPIIAAMNGGDVEKSDCRPKCKPPEPNAPITHTGNGPPVMCDIWMCDINRVPKCYQEWYSSSDHSPDDYPGMWDYNPDTKIYTFNCAEARGQLAVLYGGFNSVGLCNFNCPPPEEEPIAPVTPPPEPTRWVCYPRDGAEGICKPVGVTDPDWNKGHPSPTACAAVCNYTSGPPSGESPPARPTSGGGGGGGVSVDDGIFTDSEVLDEVLVDGGVSVDSISIDDGGGTLIGDKGSTGSESASINYSICNKINTPCDSVTISMLDAKKEYPRDGEDTPAGMWINDTQISSKVYIETKGGHADPIKCQALCVGVVTNVGGGSLVNTGDVGIFTDIIRVDDGDSGGGIGSSDPDAVVIWEPPYDIATSKGLDSEPGWVCNEDSGGCIRMDAPPGVTSYETKDECTYWCATESNGGKLLGTYSKRDGDNIND